jgi:hypothetical protein
MCLNSAEQPRTQFSLKMLIVLLTLACVVLAYLRSLPAIAAFVLLALLMAVLLQMAILFVFQSWTAPPGSESNESDRDD